MYTKRSFRFNRGFVDPLSLIAVAFLVVSIVTGTMVVNNKKISLNPNKEAATCVPEGGTYANGTGPCCSGLVQADCKSSGSFSYCICKKPPATTTPTPSTKTCTVRNCSGSSCNSTNQVVAYSQACPSSNCTSNSDCATQPTKAPTPKPTVTPTPTPTKSPTPSPPNCAKTNESCSNMSCCNSSDVCELLPGGKFCVAKGTQCTSGQYKCQTEGASSYVYSCSSGGYWQKDKACDFGCDGTSCKKACTAGAKRCNGNSLETCNSAGTAWAGQSCTYGCQTISGLSSCKATLTPTPTPKPTATVKPTTTPTQASCAKTNESCSNRSCCSSSDVCELLPGGKFCVAKGTQCTSGQQKCQAEGSSSYIYICGSGGYWQKDKACDFGCDGTSCKKACTPGAKKCNGSELQTCNSTGFAWVGQSCTYGCQTISGLSSCKVKTCEATACNNDCAQKTKGNIGTCSAGECKCSLPSLYTSYSYTPPNPSEEWTKGTQACLKDPQGDECKAFNKQMLTEGAIAATLFLGPYAIPAISALPQLGTAAYSYGTAFLSTLPASAQTALAISGTVAGYAGVAAGTAACVTDPYSEACIAYVAGLQGDPTALMQLGNSADNLLNTNTVTVYRGTYNDNTQQVANMLRDPNTGKIITNSNYVKAVYDLAENPSVTNFQKVINNATSAEQIAELQRTLRLTQNYQNRFNVSFEESLMRTHIDTMRGITNTSPYVSASYSLEEAADYIKAGNGFILKYQIPKSQVIPLTKYGLSGNEVMVKGMLPPTYVKVP